MSQSQPQPLPCPFCGAPGLVYQDDDIGDWFTECSSESEDACTIMALGGPFATEAEALAAWNRRYFPCAGDLSVELARVDAVRAKLYDLQDKYDTFENYEGPQFNQVFDLLADELLTVRLRINNLVR